jgi:hypothetical protein
MSLKRARENTVYRHIEEDNLERVEWLLKGVNINRFTPPLLFSARTLEMTQLLIRLGARKDVEHNGISLLDTLQIHVCSLPPSPEHEVSHEEEILDYLHSLDE